MISILSSKVAPSKVVDGVTKSREVLCLVGLSSDTKPATSYRGILICNGSVYDEIDTGKEYLYDEAGGEWHEQPEGDKKKDDPTAEEISVSRGSADAGKVIVVGDDGKLLPADLEVGEGAVAVDKTFKVTGAAADSKAVGDAIDSLNGSLSTLNAFIGALSGNLVGDIFAVANLSDITDFSNSYTLGAYNLTNGNFNESMSSVIDANQKAFELFSDEITIYVVDGMRVRGVILDPDKTYSAYFNWVTEGISKPDALQNKKGYYIKPIIGKVDGSKITQEEVGAYGADLFKILYPVETPIADKYDPADSYTNGDMRIYGGNLYKCRSDTTGTWDASKWERTLVSTELRKDTKPVDDTLEKEYSNVLSPEALAANGYYFDYSDGITEVPVTVGTKTTADYINLGLIPSLHIRQTFDTDGTSTARIYVYFYTDTVYLGYKQVYLKDIGADDYEMNTFAGATRIRLYVNNKNVTGDQICISTKRLDAFTLYGYTYKIKSSQLGLKLQGKVIVNFGDSIFGNKRPPNDISTEIARLTGATVYNCGFGGCRMSQASANWNPFSMYSLSNAIANNDFSAQDAIDIDTTGLPSYFKETRALLKNIDFSDVDIVTIAYGTNDFTSGVTIDNNENPKDTTTFAGALRYSLETLWSAFPHLEIFICTPTYRFWMDSSNVFQYDSDTHEVGGQLLTQFVSKVIDVAKSYHVPYIDNYNVGINQFTRTAWFPSNDGTHHNYEGAKLIAKRMANKLY